jgi:hypothetical protein
MMRFYGILSALALSAVVGTTWPAYAGLCTAQIAQVEQQISRASTNPEIGPSAPQSVGAQLGRQPTPRTFETLRPKQMRPHSGRSKGSKKPMQPVMQPAALKP